MHKVRKNATRRLRGKTSLPNDKSLDQDWSPDSPTEPSAEFSDDDFDSDDLLDMPPVSMRSIKIEQKKDEGYYKRSARVVLFDEEVLVRRIRPVYQIGGTVDRRELWYQEDEYKHIMWKARRLVKRAFNDEENTNKEKYCLRGLEHVTNSVKRRTKSNLDGRDAVLDEQHDQFKEDVFPLDDNKIASVYLPYTKVHRAEATKRAKLDAHEVALYQQTPSTTSAATPAQPSRINSVTSSSSSTHSSRSLSTSQSPLTPATAQKKPLSASGINSPSSPSLVNKPGMMFTYVDKTIQYPSGMKLDPI